MPKQVFKAIVSSSKTADSSQSDAETNHEISWIPKPSELEYCQKCQNLKIRGKPCAECANWIPEKIYEFESNRNCPELRRETETRVFSTKRLSSRNVRENYHEIKYINNRRGEYMTFGVPDGNPQNVVIVARGGIHTIATKLEGFDLLDMWHSFKDNYKRKTGKNYYHKTKHGPRRLRINI